MRILKFITLSVLVALSPIGRVYASINESIQKVLTPPELSEKVELYTEEPGSDEKPSSVFVKVPVPPHVSIQTWGVTHVLKVRLPGGGSDIDEWETAFSQIQRVFNNHALTQPILKRAWVPGIVIPEAFRDHLSNFLHQMFGKEEYKILCSDLSGITSGFNVAIFKSSDIMDHLPQYLKYLPGDMLVVFDLPGNDDLFYPQFNDVIKSVGQPSTGLVSSIDSKSSSHTNIGGSDHHKIENRPLVDFIPPLSVSTGVDSEGAVNHKLQDPTSSSHTNVGGAVSHELQETATSSQAYVGGPVELSEQVELYTEGPGSGEKPSSVFVKVPVPPRLWFHKWAALYLLKVRLPGGGSNIREWKIAFSQIKRVLEEHASEPFFLKKAWIAGIVIPEEFQVALSKFLHEMFGMKDYSILVSESSGITRGRNVVIFESAYIKNYLPGIVAHFPENMLVVFDLPGNDDLFYTGFNAVIKSVGQPSVGLVSSKSSSHTNIGGSEHHKVATGALVDFIPPLSASKGDDSEGAVHHKLQDPAPSSHANVGGAVNHKLQETAQSSRTNIGGAVHRKVEPPPTSDRPNFYRLVRRSLGF